jgi:hypothetical protein
MLSTAIWSPWLTKVSVADIFHSDASLAKIAAVCRQRLMDAGRQLVADQQLSEDDLDELDYLTRDLTEAANADEFDESWDSIYDWCDTDKRIWVVTQGSR